MSEEARDWCVAKFAGDSKYFCALHEKHTMGGDEYIVEKLTKEEALAVLASIGEVKKWLWTDEGFSAYAEE